MSSKIPPPRPSSPFTPFLRRFTDEIQLERDETIALYHRVRGKHLGSVWAAPDIVERVSNQIADITGTLLDIPIYLPLAQSLDRCLRAVIALETTVVSFPEIDWNRAHLSMREGVDLRRFLRAKEHFLANEDRVYKSLQTALGNIMGGVIQNLPPITADADSSFTVPLSEVLPNAGHVVDGIIGVLMADELVECGLFADLQSRLYENVCKASGIAPYTDSKRPLISADESELPPAELLQTYLGGTPFLDLFQTPVPFSIPEETRYAGHWIIAPPGRGKTTLLHSMFVEDADRNASIIIMDSKGDLINPIRNIQALQDRLVIIEPDPDHPLALNPLNIPNTSLTHTLALLEYVFGTLLEAKFTPLQLTLFRNVLPALLEGIENPTLAIFRDVIENGIDKYATNLKPDAQRFFDTQFKSKTYAETRNQIIWRLDYLMTNALMRTMFDAPKTKLDIGKEMDGGKIIIINNSKELLEESGAEFFGRFFIALVRAAAQRRSSRPQSEKLPCYFYIDECHDVIKRDENISTIIDQCRSQKIALILAHQRTQQIESPNVLSALSNCGIRYANSDDEAKLLADKLRTTPEFLRSLGRGTFAAFVRDLTPHAVALKVPYYNLEVLPRITPGQQESIRQRMRAEYGFTPLPPAGAPIPAAATRPPSPGQISPTAAPPPERPRPASDAPESGSTW